MHTFDSARVAVELRPQDVEALLNLHSSRCRPEDSDAMLRLALTYADHSRVCALLSSGLERVVAYFAPAFAQVTMNVGTWSGWEHEEPFAELERRLEQSIRTLERVS